MAITSEEGRQAGLKVLTAINLLSRVGATDATLTGNATIAGVCTAVLALPNLAGTGEGAREGVCRGLKLGVLIGAYSESHGFSTIAAMKSAVSAQIPNVSADFAQDLP